MSPKLKPHIQVVKILINTQTGDVQLQHTLQPVILRDILKAMYEKLESESKPQEN